MGGTICEIGGGATAHMVLTGSGDGTRGGLSSRPIAPRQRQQYNSWFIPGGGQIYEGHPVIAQIFFPFDDAKIDSMSDRVVLQALIEHLRYDLSQRIRIVLEFVGHADPRGSEDYNKQLAARRAQHVLDYVRRGVERHGKMLVPHFLYYKSIVTSLGEQFPTGDDKADRRVDIVLQSVDMKQTVNFGGPPTLITAAYKGPLTRKIQFKGWSSGSSSLKLGIGADVVEIEIRSPVNGRSAFYEYKGANVGVGVDLVIEKFIKDPTLKPLKEIAGVGVGIADTDYTELHIPSDYGWVDVEDFAGIGGLATANGIAKTGAILSFYGPKLHHQKWARQNGITVFMDGWGIQLPSISSGMGYWVRLPYNTAAERAQFYKHQQEIRDRLNQNQIGPKY